MAYMYYEDASSGWTPMGVTASPSTFVAGPIRATIVEDPANSSKTINMDSLDMVGKIGTIKIIRELIARSTIHEKIGDPMGLGEGGYTYQEVSNPIIYLPEVKRLVEVLYDQGIRLVRI